MKSVSNSSYEKDDREFSSEFLDILLAKRLEEAQPDADIEYFLLPQIPRKIVTITKTELNVLYHVARYLMTNIRNNQKTCGTCIKAVKSDKMVCHSFASLTAIEAKTSNKPLFFVDDETFKFVIQMETVFRYYYDEVGKLNINSKNFFVDKFGKIDFSLPACHNLKRNYFALPCC